MYCTSRNVILSLCKHLFLIMHLKYLFSILLPKFDENITLTHLHIS